MKSRFMIVASVAVCLLTVHSHAVVPSSITVQGRLTDLTGAPLPAGSKAFQFRIFNDTTAGSQVWPSGGVPEEQMIASDDAGLWVARVGALNPLVENDFDATIRWLQINVDGTTLPRIRLVSEPYAFRVATVDGASGGIITSKVSIGPGHSNTGNYSFVAGFANTVSGWYSAVGGGGDNVASEHYATVSGGSLNTASGLYSVVGGGFADTASADYAMVCGGESNHAAGEYSTVGGGRFNLATGMYSVVAGGGSTSVNSRNAANGSFSTVGGGEYNIADSSYTTVAGGTANWSFGSGGTISGGHFNSTDAASRDATIGGGESNSAAGRYATIPGGLQNEADGNYALAAGRRAHAQHAGSFVWADSTNSDFSSTGINQFLIRAGGGVGIGTNTPEGPLHVQDGLAGVITGNGNASAVFERDGENWLHMLTADGNQCGILFGIGTDALNGSIRYNVNDSAGYHFRAGTNDTRMILDSSGNLTADGCVVGSNIACSSDLRFKRDIATLPNAMDRVENLRGVSYRWRTKEFGDREFPDGEQVGLIAQEVREVVPQAVIEQSDGYLAVDYARLVPLLIEGMKEQQQTIDELKERLVRLESRP